MDMQSDTLPDIQLDHARRRGLPNSTRNRRRLKRFWRFAGKTQSKRRCKQEMQQHVQKATKWPTPPIREGGPELQEGGRKRFR